MSAPTEITDLERFVARHQQGLSTLAENFNEAIVIAENGKLWFANSRFLEITGFSMEEIKGLRLHEIFFRPGSSESIAEEIRIEELYKSRLQGVSQSYQTHIYRKDGQRRWVETNAAPLRDEAGKIIGSVGTITDITERKNLEEQLRWSQKMEAVGRLAGGIAHDFNNLLTVINGYAREIRNAVADTPELLQQVDTIIGASESASALTKQLLTISRRQVVRMLPLRLNDMVKNSLQVIEGLATDNIEIETLLASDLPLISADSSQIQQVLLNLVVNALDAMPKGGLIKISTALVDGRNEVVSNPDSLEGKFIRLRVSDSGCGIPEDIKSKIFEPFYTTKRGKIKGSGLGLSITFGIVKDHNGEILIESEPGQGATFDILLPAIEGVANGYFQTNDERLSTGGAEVILLVEDEIAIRNLFKDSLQKLGYTVLDVIDGAEALELATHVKKIDLLITDIIMPKVDGLELMETLLAARPTLKTIVMSGFTDQKNIGDTLKRLRCEFLEKPFSPDKLAKLVRSVLDRRDGETSTVLTPPVEA